VGFEIAVAINATTEVVWAVLTDVEHWPQWTASVKTVTRLDGADLCLGSRVEIKQPKLPTMLWTVTELDPGRSFTWQAKRTGATMRARHQLRGLAEGPVHVTLGVDQSGPIGRLLGAPPFSTFAKRYVQMEADGLKQRSEGRPAR